MNVHLKIEVGLKPTYNDPEGETTANLLRGLGYDVEAVSVGKVYYISLRTNSIPDAEIKANRMCREFLANPIKDNYSISIEVGQ
jgi:phosphoribosylformylglycinamidine synthase PurS subunit